MSDFFGVDVGNLIASIGGALHSLVPAPSPEQGFQPADQAGGQFAPAPLVGGAGEWPTLTMTNQGFQPAQFNLGNFRPAGQIGQGFLPADLLGQTFAPGPGLGGSPFQPSVFNPLAPKPATPTGGTPGATTPATPGAGFGNPSAQQLDQMFAGTALAGQGQTVLQAAQRYGVPASLAVAILKAESSFQTPAGGTRNNYGGLKDPQTGGFADFPDVATGLDAVIRNMGSGIYHGLPLRDFLYKYLGGPEGGNVPQYYANVLATIAALGGTTDLSAVPVGAPQQAGGASIPAGPALQTLFGGNVPPVMQEFGHTAYSEAHPDTYRYGNAYGLEGSQHPGVDYGLARGSQLYVPVSGTVRYAGGTGYYTDQNGDGPGRGELMIELANGDQIIMGHMSQIGLQVGQQVNAGTFAGLSGGSDGDHVHLEVRRKNANGGYTIVDPRSYFGGQ